ncbi:MAG: glycosyltransferase [Sulfurimonas sp.]|jgi:glycosyltransferase involved in cell wall biosynthesis|nr:glycosyltransferase [Sulfurimonas sp.]
MNNEHPVKLSVTVITYNQEHFIEETLDSILSQKLNVPFDIVIGDDASTDKTPDILKKYAEKYPEIVKPIFRTKNFGHTGNYIETSRMATGEYIAHLDGDDLMLLGKLQKQVDFLDSHQECSMVHHLVSFIDKQGNITGKTKERSATVGTINDIIKQNHIINSSNMFRRNCLDEHFYNIPHSLMLHDKLAHMIKTQYGKVCVIPEILGSYRVYSESIFKSASSYKLFKAQIYTVDYAKNLKGASEKSIRAGKSILYLARVREYYKKKNYTRAKYYLMLARNLVPYSYDACRFALKLLVK